MLSRYDTNDLEQMACLVCTPAYDHDKAKHMTSLKVREFYPRFEGTCKVCGYRGVKYASVEHYLTGDY